MVAARSARRGRRETLVPQDLRATSDQPDPKATLALPVLRDLRAILGRRAVRDRRDLPELMARRDQRVLMGHKVLWARRVIKGLQELMERKDLLDRKVFPVQRELTASPDPLARTAPLALQGCKA